MGIGRRQFLKLFGSVIASASTSPLQAIIVDGDLYINRALGLAFRKPPGWHYFSIESFENVRSDQILLDGELSEAIVSAEGPVVVMTQNSPDITDRPGPCITVYVEPFHYQEGESLIGFLPSINATYNKILSGYVQSGAANELEVSGCESISYKSRFLFEHKSFSLPANHRAMIVVREPYIYTFNMFEYPTEQVASVGEYDRFISSIALV